MIYISQEELAARSFIAAKRGRLSRWNAKGKSRVVHPKHGEVIVPHESCLAAILCACEVWGTTFGEISEEVEVWECDQTLPAAKMPEIGETNEQSTIPAPGRPGD